MFAPCTPPYLTPPYSTSPYSTPPYMTPHPQGQSRALNVPEILLAIFEYLLRPDASILMTHEPHTGNALSRLPSTWWRPLLVNRFWFKTGCSMAFRSVQLDPVQGMPEDFAVSLTGSHQFICTLPCPGALLKSPMFLDQVLKQWAIASQGKVSPSSFPHSLHSLNELSLNQLASMSVVQKMLANPTLRSHLTLLKLSFSDHDTVPIHLLLAPPTINNTSDSLACASQDTSDSSACASQDTPLLHLPRLRHLLLHNATVARLPTTLGSSMHEPRLTTLRLDQVRIEPNDLRRLLLAVASPWLAQVALRQLAPLNPPHHLVCHDGRELLPKTFLGVWTAACPNLQWLQVGDWAAATAFDMILHIAQSVRPSLLHSFVEEEKEEEEVDQRRQQQQQQQQLSPRQPREHRYQRQLPTRQQRIECVEREIFEARTQIAFVWTLPLCGRKQLTRLEIAGRQIHHRELSRLAHQFLCSDEAIQLQEVVFPGFEYQSKYFDPCPNINSDAQIPLDDDEDEDEDDGGGGGGSGRGSRPRSTRPWACTGLRVLVLTINPYDYYCTTPLHRTLDPYAANVRASRGVCGFIVASCPRLETLELRFLYHPLDLDPDGGLCFLGRLAHLQHLVLHGEDFVRGGPGLGPWWSRRWRARQRRRRPYANDARFTMGPVVRGLQALRPRWVGTPEFGAQLPSQKQQQQQQQPDTVMIPSPWPRSLLDLAGYGKIGERKKNKKNKKSKESNRDRRSDKTVDGEGQNNDDDDDDDDDGALLELELPLLRWMAREPTEEDRQRQWTNVAWCRRLRQMDGGLCETEAGTSRQGGKWSAWKPNSLFGNGRSSLGKRHPLPEWTQHLDSLLTDTSSRNNANGSGMHEGSNWHRLATFKVYFDCVDFHLDARKRRAMSEFCIHYERALRQVLLPSQVQVAVHWNDVRQLVNDISPSAKILPLSHGHSQFL